jgi:hypothetical protein
MHPQTEKSMKKSNVIVAASLLLLASLLIWATAVVAQQPKPEKSGNAHQLSDADNKAIQDIIKDQEAAWNNHDMKAFTKSFRDDAEGINIVGMHVCKARCSKIKEASPARHYHCRRCEIIWDLGTPHEWGLNMALVTKGCEKWS